ncbi:MAG: chloride channel protein, partial [Actinomycetota bacterium]|nr:chloride channel protein [Actinomycetota bacterium]
LGRRGRQVLILAAVTGALTGLCVAGFEWVTRQGLSDHLGHEPRAVRIAAPLLGLLVAAALLRWVASTTSPSTADEYIHNFHEPGRRLDLRPVAGRILASVATLGLGGAMGYEGPSIYLGATVGSVLQRRFSRHFTRDDAKVLLVAGAAAGVAAIFKAPATGLVFALEVPYQDDFARRMLLPAGIAAAVSYVVFVAFSGTAPLFAVSGSPPFDLRDLGGAALLGVLCGIGARLFTKTLLAAKRLATRIHPVVRAAGAGTVLVALALVSKIAFGSPLTLGAGYDNLTWALDPRRAVALVLLLLVLRAAATIATVGGGGVGGLFVPLVIEGALLGRAMGGLFRTAASGSHFFPLVGVSAFLGAGYRVPLAGVVFAAEASGRPGFIVPGLIAAMVAQLFMGHASASPYQVAARAGHLERRFPLPITDALRTDVATMPPTPPWRSSSATTSSPITTRRSRSSTAPATWASWASRSSKPSHRTNGTANTSATTCAPTSPPPTPPCRSATPSRSWETPTSICFPCSTETHSSAWSQQPRSLSSTRSLTKPAGNREAAKVPAPRPIGKGTISTSIGGG